MASSNDSDTAEEINRNNYRVQQVQKLAKNEPHKLYTKAEVALERLKAKIEAGQWIRKNAYWGDGNPSDVDRYIAELDKQIKELSDE